ncbi:hypothetical protein HOY82DRAFT_281085 [Tuber indicum]|nr:hypothetical protein HOY82DRAFT_281085 [Tuber indicum]
MTCSAALYFFGMKSKGGFAAILCVYWISFVRSLWCWQGCSELPVMAVSVSARSINVNLLFQLTVGSGSKAAQNTTAGGPPKSTRRALDESPLSARDPMSIK